MASETNPESFVVCGRVIGAAGGCGDFLARPVSSMIGSTNCDCIFLARKACRRLFPATGFITTQWGRRRDRLWCWCMGLAVARKTGRTLRHTW